MGDTGVPDSHLSGATLGPHFDFSTCTTRTSAAAAGSLQAEHLAVVSDALHVAPLSNFNREAIDTSLRFSFNIRHFYFFTHGDGNQAVKSIRPCLDCQPKSDFFSAHPECNWMALL